MEDLQVASFEAIASALRLWRKHCWSVLAGARIMRKRFTVPVVKRGGHDVYFCGQCSQSGGRRRHILELHRARAVVSDYFRLRHQVLNQQMPKGNEIVDKKAQSGKDQRSAAG